MDSRQVFPEKHFEGCRVIEVGAGCGLTSIYAALRGADVTITDMDIGENGIYRGLVHGGAFCGGWEWRCVRPVHVMAAFGFVFGDQGERSSLLPSDTA